MKHSLKKWAALFGCSFMCVQLLTAAPALAATEEDNSDSTYLWEEFAPEGTTSVEDTATPRARGDILNRGYIKLSNSGGQAGVYGETLCNYTIDEVGVELYLEQYTGSSYRSYLSWDCVATNAYKATKSVTVPVAKGYYYRLRGYHYALDDSMFENAITETDGLPL